MADGYTDQLYALLPFWQSEFGLSYAGLAVVRALYYGTMGGLQVPGDWLIATAFEINRKEAWSRKLRHCFRQKVAVAQSLPALLCACEKKRTLPEATFSATRKLNDFS